MELSVAWIYILASLLMGLAGVCIFIFAIKTDLFRNIEDIKYQVFWSDLEEPPEHSMEQENNENGSGKKVSSRA